MNQRIHIQVLIWSLDPISPISLLNAIKLRVEECLRQDPGVRRFSIARE